MSASALAALKTVRSATPEALNLAYHTAVTCPTCRNAEAAAIANGNLPCLADFCLTGQALFLAAVRAEAVVRRAAKAAAQGCAGGRR